MNQALICQGLTALYLIAGGSILEVNGNIESKIAFKAAPLLLGVWMALNTLAQYKGWPI